MRKLMPGANATLARRCLMLYNLGADIPQLEA